MKKDPWTKHKTIYGQPPQIKPKKKERLKWRLWSVLWLAFKRTCTVIGAVIVIGSILISWSISSVVSNESEKELPNKMVLQIKLEGGIGDLPKSASFADPFSDNKKTVRNVIDAIYRAKDDPRVEGIYAQMEGGAYAITHIQELRTAITDFRSSGKFAYIYGTSYSNGLGSYYLATAFDQRWLQPMGIVMITGLNAEMPFARDVLDKIGIEPQFFQRKKYKNAYDTFTRSEMSDANREATQALVSDIANALVIDISKDLGISQNAFNALVDRGLYLDQEAKKNGLVDYVAYEDELFKAINAQVNGSPDIDADYVQFGSYLAEMMKERGEEESLFPKDNSKKKKTEKSIALIYAVGAIMDTDGNSASSAPSIMVDDGIAAADEISDALRSAADDENIGGVVLRIDSPGGSPVASETILRAIENVKSKGKHVTVSMGSAAASGGYWIAAPADQIFVLPTTITGSIGVLGGKVSMKKMWENIGINWDNVTWGENAKLFSANSPFSESEAERMNAMLDNVYDNFLMRVSKGRNMSVEEVDRIAGGRVWSGTRAIKVGLADQVGGLNEALDYAAVKLDKKDRNDIDVIVLPKPLSQIEQFIELLEGQVYAGKMIGAQAHLFEALQPLATDLIMIQNAQTNTVYSPVRIK